MGFGGNPKMLAVSAIQMELSRYHAAEFCVEGARHNPHMPNLATLLKSEIARLARKELKTETATLRKTVASLRTELLATKKKVRELEADLKLIGRPGSVRQAAGPASAPSPAKSSNGSTFRFSSKGLATNRARLKLSAVAYGRLVGTTGVAVAAWEKGTSRPRAKYLPAIAELRGVGKREVARRLEALNSQKE